MMTKTVYLRPHHGLCILLFTRRGHSTPYSSVMIELTTLFRNEPKQRILLQTELDSVCEYCPHNEKGFCHKSDEVNESDRKILSYCGLESGHLLLWEEFEQRMFGNILKGDKLMEACAGCDYLSRCETIRRKQVQSL